jgi:hypothetical protein
MQDEAFRRLPNAPSSQSPQLQDGQALGGRVVRPPMRRETSALRPEDLQLPAEQVHLRGLLIPLDQQTQDG